MNLKKIYFLFLALFFYYILSPAILIKYYQIDEISLDSVRYVIDSYHNKYLSDVPNIYKFIGERLYLYKTIQNENYKYYEIFSISFLFIFLFILYSCFKNIKLTHPGFVVKDYKIIFNFVSILCIFFLLKDLILIINYYYSVKIILREELYELINNRKTYLNILIFSSVINFKFNKIVIIIKSNFFSNQTITNPKFVIA